jgi:hypothetical protein
MPTIELTFTKLPTAIELSDCLERLHPNRYFRRVVIEKVIKPKYSILAVDQVSEMLEQIINRTDCFGYSMIEIKEMLEQIINRTDCFGYSMIEINIENNKQG